MPGVRLDPCHSLPFECRLLRCVASQSRVDCAWPSSVVRPSHRCALNASLRNQACLAIAAKLRDRHCDGTRSVDGCAQSPVCRLRCVATSRTMKRRREHEARGVAWFNRVDSQWASHVIRYQDQFASTMSRSVKSIAQSVLRSAPQSPQSPHGPHPASSRTMSAKSTVPSPSASPDTAPPASITRF